MVRRRLTVVCLGYRLLALFALFCVCLCCLPVSYGFSAPGFVTVKSVPANMRLGPGIGYPISWVYIEPYVPFKVLDSFEDWLKVEDVEGAQGWMHKVLLGRKGYVMSKKKIEVRRLQSRNSSVLAVVEPYVVLQLINCFEGDWCRIQVEGVKAWAFRRDLWGV